MSDPYRAPPCASVELVFMDGPSYRDGAEKRLADLLSQGYSIAAHSGGQNDCGTYRALWTLVRTGAAA